MQLVREAEATKWMAEVGIGAHPRFPSNLAFLQAPDLHASWLPTGRITDVPGFLQTAVGLAGEDGTFWLYRKGGGTWYEDEDAPIGNQIIDRVLSALGVPRDFQGALVFESSEWRELYLVIGTFFVWGWSVGEDLYIIPAAGSCMLMTSHHGELFGLFPVREALMRFEAEMELAGYAAR